MKTYRGDGGKGLRVTSVAKTAALRMAEALGFTMASSGRTWTLSYDQKVPNYLRVDDGVGPLTWTGSFTAEGCMGVMAGVALSSQGLGLSPAELWDLCKYAPSRDRDGGWLVEDTWAGNAVLWMLAGAKKAGRPELQEDES